MVSFEFYDPSNILMDNNTPQKMGGPQNFALARSFFHSRQHNAPHEAPHQCNATLNGAVYRRYDEFDRNAGAAVLYKKDGITIYNIPGQNNKEYHYISYGNKYFKEYTKHKYGFKASSYGHSERILMRDILDDLISANPSDQGEISRPSSNFRSQNRQEQEFEVLKYLTDNASKYKEYLYNKNLIVKMWSERPACNAESNIGVGGGNCKQFIEDICPEGSQFGYILQDYTRKDNQDGAPKVENAFTAFRAAYQA